jgi:four helix bundle protein
MEYDFEKLVVWQKSMRLAADVYAVTKKFPTDEKYGLVSQIRRASISVPSNIAEGKGRYHTKEYVHFLYIARGSLYETMTLLKLCETLGFATDKETSRLLASSWDVSGGINGLINSLK